MTRSAAVAAELRRLIRTGELPAGTRLRQVDIAQRFSVSTTPVREAFTVLAREGLVTQDAHRGVIVFVPSKDDLEQNYEIRIELEALAASIAATNATEADLEQLTQIVDEMRTTLTKDTHRYGVVLNPAFHAALYGAAHRPRLAELIHQLRDASAAYLHLLSSTPQPEGYLHAAQTEHEQIVEALRQGNSQGAAEAVTRHLERNRDQILSSLERAPDDEAAAPAPTRR